MVDQRDLLAREVDDELRREQLLKLWELYGTYVIAAAVLIIVGIGGVKYYQYRSAAAAEAAGSRFVAAVQEAQGKPDDARKDLEAIAAKGPAGYATLARLRLAAADAASGKTMEAAGQFEAIARDSGVDILLRDYAQLQAAVLRLDTATWTDMQNRLNDLAAEQNPWHNSARELRGLAAYKAGMTEDARQEFQRLMGDPAVPQGIAERARMMMGLLVQADAPKAPLTSDKPAETPAKAEAKKPK
jgi:hypothetical protein